MVLLQKLSVPAQNLRVYEALLNFQGLVKLRSHYLLRGYNHGFFVRNDGC